MGESFNLLTEKWIPVLWNDGRASKVGIIEALRNAQAIRQLNETSILEQAGIVRLLAAYVHWRHPLHNKDEWASLWEERGLPLAALEDLSPEKEAGFNLLGNGPRFFQDNAASRMGSLSANNLFCDLPAGTNINHLHHIRDSQFLCCPQCAARALVCLPAFCTQGGAGKSPSINGAPPIYFLPAGASLGETLLLNLPVPGSLPDWPTNSGEEHPAWDSGKSLKGPIGFCEGMTWQARSVYLKAERAGNRTCSRCGDAPDAVISQAVYSAGRGFQEVETRGWRDPHAALAEEGGGPLRALDEIKKKTRDAAAARWTWEIRRILALPTNGTGPPAVRQAVLLLDALPVKQNQELWVRVVRHPTSQMKRLDATAVEWRVPLSFWRETELNALASGFMDDLGRAAKALPRGAVRAFHVLAQSAFQEFLQTPFAEVSTNTIRRDWRQTMAQCADESLMTAVPPVKRAWNVMETIENVVNRRRRVAHELERAEGGGQ